MIATYNPYEPRYADPDPGSGGPTGSSGTWPECDMNYISFDYWRFIESPMPDEPDVILKNKGPELEPKPTWKLPPAKSITIRPEMRIKQPVSRAGYRRGNRV